MIENRQEPAPSKIFGRYADYYDAFYSEKDYARESRFVMGLLHEYSELDVESLLDVGCGTGGHMIHFAKAGLRVTGLDASEAMIQKAQEKIAATDREIPKPWIYCPMAVLADIRSFNANRRYDAAVAMFAVTGYLTTNSDLTAMFINIRSHLKTGAYLIFDVWFGPAVYCMKPETRIKELLQEDSKTIRFAIPEIDSLRNVVRVNYTILEIRTGQLVSETKEVHEMRFFFLPELEFLLSKADLQLAEVCPFMERGRAPSTTDWNISVIAKAV